MKLQVDEITRETLDALEEQWEQTRLKNLVRDEVTALGRRYRQACAQAERLEGQCMMRARKMWLLGFDKKEVAELFDVHQNQVTKWIKGME